MVHLVRTLYGCSANACERAENTRATAAVRVNLLSIRRTRFVVIRSPILDAAIISGRLCNHRKVTLIQPEFLRDKSFDYIKLTQTLPLGREAGSGTAGEAPQIPLQ